jgi:hypothetical protein
MTTEKAPRSQAVNPASGGGRRKKGWYLGAAAAVALTAGIGVLGPGHERSASAAIAAAAVEAEQVKTLRFSYLDNTSGHERGLNAEIAENAARIRFTRGPAAGAAVTDLRDDEQSSQPGEEVEFDIRDTYLTGFSGLTVKGLGLRASLGGPAWRQDFGTSTRDLLSALLAGEKPADAGSDRVRGVDARHLRVEVGPEVQKSLAKLLAGDPEYLEWFGIYQVKEVRQIDVWVSADDLVRRIQVRGPAGLATIDYYDFNGPKTIGPPVTAPGPAAGTTWALRTCDGPFRNQIPYPTRSPGSDAITMGPATCPGETGPSEP